MGVFKVSRFDRIADIAAADIDMEHYKWGNVMGMFFSVAEVLNASDIAGDVTPEPFARWGYGPSPMAIPDIETITGRAEDYREGEWSDDYRYSTIALAIAYAEGEITQGDLIYAGDVLHRYSILLDRAGKSY